MNDPKIIGDWIQTFSGKQFWPLDPKPEEVDLEDIAHALSMQCRFGGHCKTFYSVAEHSVRVSKILPKELALIGLFHDAAEAYLIDVPRPIKHQIPAFSEIENKILQEIGKRFDIVLDPLPLEIKYADSVLLATEKRDLMKIGPKAWSHLPEPLSDKIYPVSYDVAKEMFLDRFYELFDKVNYEVVLSKEG